jgi:hypothetical protein
MTDEAESMVGQAEPTVDQDESIGVGDLVTVSGDGPVLDGIVFDLPSRSKAVVAVVDRKRGPVFRSVGVDALAARAEEGPNDHALHLLIRRTPGGGRTGGPARTGTTHGSAGFARPAAHRPTGR